MNSELIISSTNEGVKIALLENKKLAELHTEKPDVRFNVGDIYLARVQRIMTGLNAAFIDVGYSKDAFLHYLDMGPQFRNLNKYLLALKRQPGVQDISKLTLEPDIEKTGKITQLLKKSHMVLVQIVKEPIANKGPRLSSSLGIAGRHMVLIPFTNSVSVSKKIRNIDERKRLLRLMESILPKNFGAIIRTAAEGKPAFELDKDLRTLLEKWQSMCEKVKAAPLPSKVLGEMDRAFSMLRDILNPNFDSITVDDESIHEEIKNYIRHISPEQEKIVNIYNGKTHLFESSGIEKQIKGLFGKKVEMDSGAYLIIEHTEAMHVIDVNSGSAPSEGHDQESHAIQINTEAASEIARQLRLRDMGGIIILDFIDMRNPHNRFKLFQHMREEVKRDRSKLTVLPLSKFGLMQITRQRVRPEMNIVTAEQCPACKGTGQIQPTILLEDDIQKNMDYVLKQLREQKIILHVHPFIHAYLTKGFMNQQKKWLLKYGKWVRIVSDTSLPINEYKFLNAVEEEIKLQ